VLVLAGGCGDDDVSPDTGAASPTAGEVMAFESPAFASGSAIPPAYTCDGDDASPPLRWDDVPLDAETLAVEMLDRDADGFVHWIIFDIPADTGGLTAVLPREAEIDEGKQAINTFGEMGYGGPCPPEGEEHEYVFRLYALDAPLGLEGGGSAGDVQEALAEHTLALSEIAAVYGR
jgi:hypothetical protein